MSPARPLPAAALALALAAPGYAQGPPGKRPKVVLGAGAVAAPSPYKGVSSHVTPVPFINLQRERFFLRGVQAGWRLWQTNGASLAAVAQPQFQGYEPGDSPALAGMDRRRWSVDGGLQLTARRGDLRLSLQALHDLLGRHNGLLASAGVSYELGDPRRTVAPGVGLEWEGPDYVAYYYGVRPAEGRPGRPAYDGRGALNPYIGVQARYGFGGHWGLFAYLRHRWLDDAITDSPIVAGDTVYSGVVAVTYSFF
ncbi:MAG TPA: MipA/OmpV family protein [Gammaproteobacteria bacterium]|nr:MipA/OmpV family protein [Gammaproteobacteria bacterium]